MDQSGLLFPKPGKKKKNKKIKHPASIMHDKGSRTCYLCIVLHDNYNRHDYLEEHHVFGGRNRNQSENFGLKCYLCNRHHVYGNEAVHANPEIMDQLKAAGRAAFEDKYPEMDFVKIFN